MSCNSEQYNAVQTGVHIQARYVTTPQRSFATSQLFLRRFESRASRRNALMRTWLPSHSLQIHRQAKERARKTPNLIQQLFTNALALLFLYLLYVSLVCSGRIYCSATFSFALRPSQTCRRKSFVRHFIYRIFAFNFANFCSNVKFELLKFDRTCQYVSL